MFPIFNVFLKGEKSIITIFICSNFYIRVFLLVLSFTVLFIFSITYYTYIKYLTFVGYFLRIVNSYIAHSNCDNIYSKLGITKFKYKDKLSVIR